MTESGTEDLEVVAGKMEDDFSDDEAGCRVWIRAVEGGADEETGAEMESETRAVEAVGVVIGSVDARETRRVVTRVEEVIGVEIGSNGRQMVVQRRQSEGAASKVFGLNG